MRLNAVLAFWIAYILTRPLGASLGDYLTQTPDDGGVGLGAVWTSVIFLVAILGTVVYLTKTRVDASVEDGIETAAARPMPSRGTGIGKDAV